MLIPTDLVVNYDKICGDQYNGPSSHCKSQNNLNLNHLTCHYLIGMLHKSNHDLEFGKIYNTPFLWLCTL